MNKKVVLFDLDGTLLSVDMEVFTKRYLKMLTDKMSDCGYEPNKLVESILAGTNEMMRNSGHKNNENVFWDAMKLIYGEDVEKDKNLFDAFYRNEFQSMKSSVCYKEKAVEMVRTLKQRGVRVVLATNPIFPAVATESRVRWAGFEPQEFELITTYENCRFCKPNPNYYLDIAGKLDVRCEDCLMVGNDATEDMAAAKAGMTVFLLNDFVVNRDKVDTSVFNQGGVDECMQFIESFLNKE